MRYLGIIGLIVALFMLPGVSPAVQDANPPDQQQTAVGQTPPRLSFVDGQVSFRRPGSQDWTQAQLNTPLAAGDQLYTGSPGNLELQIGSRAFVRAWADTQLELKNQEPDFLRFEVMTGYVAFDLRTVEPGRTIMVDTPNAAFTIEDAGYYRVDVNSDGTSFITRRGGHAAVTAGSGRSLIIAPSEEVVIEGPVSQQITVYMAPPLDEWDNWNYARTDHLLETLSARYVSPEIYGAGDLDAYGTWRTVSGRGPVWVPTAVPPGWVPYSTGAWFMDPHYGWTWVDTEPWGWAPYHYGRWVFVDGFWGWAPGPVQVRPVYAPALVAFFGGPGGRAGAAEGGGPVVGWVALGWGEPLIPWWGPTGFIQRPWWGGWGGPRVVNNRVINQTTVVNVKNITVYRNAGVHNALVTVNENHFGRGPIGSGHIARVDAKNFRPRPTPPRINAAPASFKPDARPGSRPPAGSLKRPAAAPGPAHTGSGQALTRESKTGPSGFSGPAHRLAEPNRREPAPALPRLPSGHGTLERPGGDRALAPASQKHEGPLAAREVAKAGPAVTRRASPQPYNKPQATGPAAVRPQLQVRRPEGSQRAGEIAKAGPSVARQAPAQSRRKPQATGPVTVRPQLQARRPESRHPPAREFQSAQPNQLSENRFKVEKASGTSAGPQSKVRRKSGVGRGEPDGG